MATLARTAMAMTSLAAAPSNELLIIPRVEGLRLSMTYLRDGLKHLAEDTDGLVVLIVLDCCCAAVKFWKVLIFHSNVAFPPIFMKKLYACLYLDL